MDDSDLDKKEVQRAVSIAYENAIQTFIDNLDGNDHKYFISLLQLDTATNVKEILSELRGGYSPRKYMIHDPDWKHELNGLQNKLADDPTNNLPEPMDREYDIDTYLWSDRVLIVGPRGAGKTRTLIHLIKNQADRIDRIIRVRSQTESHGNWGFYQEKFEGDVLFIWDEMGKNSRPQIFKEAVNELGQYFEKKEQKFTIIVTLGTAEEINDKIKMLRHLRVRQINSGRILKY